MSGQEASSQVRSRVSLDAAGRRVALFDLDRTILAGSSLACLGRVMLRHGFLRGRVARELLREVSFARTGSTDEAANRLQERLLRFAAGRPYAELHELTGEALVEMTGRFYRGAEWLLGRHRDAGDLTVVVSASPQDLVDAVADRVGADIAVGTQVEVEDGILTGRLRGAFCYGEGKLLRLAADLGPFDWATSTAYSDSLSDLPMLKRAGSPVAVNPDRRLLSEARRAGWPVIRFH